MISKSYLCINHCCLIISNC